MKRGLWIALLAAGSLAWAQNTNGQAGGSGSSQQQNKSPNAEPNAAPPSNANPFPENTTDVPVMPSNTEQPQPDTVGNGRMDVPMPGEDIDPARSPEDPAPATSSDQESGFSSSLKGLENVAPAPEPDEPVKKGKKEKTHQEASAEDLEVGKYYLNQKNWKAALSRLQSAMVLDPENPEVYWSLAEAERHLNDFADAKAYYEKLLEYDPDGPHGKEARKAMKDPQIANAQSPAAAHP